jgi:hypothetical protein
MKKWEYCIVRITLSASRLNDFGRDGWEVVSIVLGEDALVPRVVFKREITPESNLP